MPPSESTARIKVGWVRSVSLVLMLERVPSCLQLRPSDVWAARGARPPTVATRVGVHRSRVRRVGSFRVLDTRTIRRGFALAATAASVLALAACGGGSSRGSASSGGASSGVYLAAVTKAADVTGQVPGYKFAISIGSKIASKSVAFSGTGSISERGAQGALEMNVAGKRISEIIDKPYFYIKVPGGGERSATHGKPWVRVETSALTASLGGESLSNSTADPTQTLGFLKSAGTVTRVGSETVRGAPTTRYHAVIDLERFAAAAAPADRADAKRYAEAFEKVSGSSSLPMDVWIDQQSRVARMAFTLSLCGFGGNRLHESLNYELYGYGPQPVLAPPPASQVTDITARLKAQVAKGLQELSCK